MVERAPDGARVIKMDTRNVKACLIGAPVEDGYLKHSGEAVGRRAPPLTGPALTLCTLVPRYQTRLVLSPPASGPRPDPLAPPRACRRSGRASEHPGHVRSVAYGRGRGLAVSCRHGWSSADRATRGAHRCQRRHDPALRADRRTAQGRADRRRIPAVPLVGGSSGQAGSACAAIRIFAARRGRVPADARGWRHPLSRRSRRSGSHSDGRGSANRRTDGGPKGHGPDAPGLGPPSGPHARKPAGAPAGVLECRQSSGSHFDVTPEVEALNAPPVAP